jgi:quinol monooxygenase YgiN
MLIVTGYVQVPPSELPAFTRDLADLARITRERDGALSYDAAVIDASRGRLLVMERWRDQHALSAHLAAADTIAFVARWDARLSADIRKYDATRERGLADA